MVNLSTVAPLGTGKRYVASRLRSVWLRKVCSTVVIATCSSIATVTLWLTIARGGSFLSSGMSNPAAGAELVTRATANTGRAYRRNRMAHLRQEENGSAAAEALSL